MIFMKVYGELAGAVRRAVSALRLDDTQTATVSLAAIRAVKSELQKLGVKDGPAWEYGEFDGRDVYVLTEKRLDDGSEVTRHDGAVWIVEWSMWRGDGWLHSVTPAVTQPTEGPRTRLLNQMTRQAYEVGLYDVDADTYREALDAARKRNPDK